MKTRTKHDECKRWRVYTYALLVVVAALLIELAVSSIVLKRDAEAMRYCLEHGVSISAGDQN